MILVTSFAGFSSVLSNASNPQKNEQNYTVQDPVPLPAESPWWDTNWSYRKQIIIDHTQVAGDITNFPILIHNTSLDFAVHAQPYGDDFVFTINDGIRLNHEIESYNTTTGELITWVNITSLSSSVDTILWMYYGNPSSDNQQDSEGTWDGNYVAVWHFGEIVGNIVSDSTKNHFNATANEYTTVSDGFIGKARSFNAGDGAVYVGAHEEFGGMPSYSIETYAYPYSINSERRIFDRSESYETNPNTILLSLYNGPLLLTTNNLDGIIFNNPFSANTWNYIAGVYSGSGGEQALYINGTKVASDTTIFYGPTAGSFNVTIGDCAFGWDYPWDGKLDEMRFSKIARTSQWILTSNNSMSSPETFMTIGDEEIENYPPVANFTYTINELSVTFDASSSYDPDGEILVWYWSFGDGNGALGETFTHDYFKSGTYNVTLTVVDDNSAEDFITKSISVEKYDRVFIYGIIINLTTAGDTIMFDAVNIKVINFQPFSFIPYMSGEQFTILNNYKGFLGYRFVFALCKILI
jgi:PKD repeat protein